jgi:glycosyltransferase involved in cell wall biosynthesis
MNKVGILHYSAPPVVGGVENVILTHARLLMEAGYQTMILAGKGEQAAIPSPIKLVCIPELDSGYPQILKDTQELEQGSLPRDFDITVNHLTQLLPTQISDLDLLIVHNVFTKHFNLPLTAALFHLLDHGMIHRCIAWCHDLSWTSPHSRSKVHPGYPWDLLRTYHPDVTYVTVSKKRQAEMSEMFGCPPSQIRVIYNGVNSAELLGLSNRGLALIEQMNLWGSDLILLMPVRVTQAKNIELALHIVAALKEKRIHPKLVVTGPPDPHDPTNMEYFRSLRALRTRLDVEQETHFVCELGPSPTEPFILDMSVVAELMRVSDALFMSSHREGFGMPILEAGLTGIPIFCTDAIPAAQEIAARDIVTFSLEAGPVQIAELILERLNANSTYRLRRRMRQSFDWHMLFQHEILPLLEQRDP